MPRAPATSILDSPVAHQPGLNRRLRRWLAAELYALRPVLRASAARCQANHARKHFDARAHACFLLFHGLSASPSLRQSYTAFAGCPGLVALAGGATNPAGDGLDVGFSQAAASSHTRPAAFLAGLVPVLSQRVRHLGIRPGVALPADLRVLDSTFLRLSAAWAPWLPPVGASPRDVPGVRVQVQYAPALDLPEHFLITDTRTNDCQGLDQAVLDDPARLAALVGQTLAIDLGYYSHQRFARALGAGVHLVTRRHPQATLRVEADRPIAPPLPGLGEPRITVGADQRVTVGSAHNRAGAVLPGLRLVTATVAPQPAAARRGAQPLVYEVLTDRWDLPAAQVVQLYLWRWQIELFFRWLKRQVRLPRLLGYSRNAVELTVWLALIVHLLTVLAARALGWTRRTPTLLAQLGWALAQVSLADLPAGRPQPRQLPLPGAGGAPAAPT
jgi:hypothetical protein